MAHWETNGTALSSVVRPEVKPKSYPPTPRSLLEALVTSAVKATEEEATLVMPQTPLSSTTIPELSESAPLRSLTNDLNQTVPDQWQIATETSPIVLNTSDDPKVDDSLPMPSSIHRDSLALLTLVLPSPIPLLSSPLQEPAIKEPASSTPFSTYFQPDVTFVPNLSLIPFVIMKAFKSEPTQSVHCLPLM